MKTRALLAKLALAATLSLVPISLSANEIPELLDDFSDPQNNSLGFARMVIDDTTAGGQSHSAQTVVDGVLTSKGDIAPPRGQPGWVSMVFLLNADGSPADVSQYEGIRLRLRIDKGMVSVSANSAEVKNFDYHAAMIQASGGDAFQETRIPFASLRRAWSEQTRLNTETIASVSLVAVGIQKGPFSFDIDEIGFY